MEPVTTGIAVSAALGFGSKVLGGLMGSDNAAQEAAMNEAILVQGMMVAMPILSMTRESLLQEN